MYGKLFASTYTGSMFGAGSVVFAVWGYALANASKDGLVELNPALIAAVLGDSVEEVSAAIAYLCSPDDRSRSKAEDGRRLIPCGQFAHQIVNYGAYRSLGNDDARRAYLRDAKRKSRAKQRASTQASTLVPQTSTQAEVEVEVEAEVEGGEPPPQPLPPIRARASRPQGEGDGDEPWREVLTEIWHLTPEGAQRLRAGRNPPPGLVDLLSRSDVAEVSATLARWVEACPEDARRWWGWGMFQPQRWDIIASKAVLPTNGHGKKFVERDLDRGGFFYVTRQGVRVECDEHGKPLERGKNESQ